MYRTPPGGGDPFPVFTSYEEWEEGNHREADMHCQGCHMPSRAGAAAPGADAREAIAHHGTMGDTERLRARAIQLTLDATRGPERTALTVQVANRGAGHAVPSGLPARRVALNVRALRGEQELATQQKVYGRVLVDAAGQEAPFYAATALSRDDRLASDERRQEKFELEVPRDATLEVTVVWQEVAPAIAARLGVEVPREVTLARARLDPGKVHATSDTP
jgi:hypothetical protein